MHQSLEDFTKLISTSRTNFCLPLAGIACMISWSPNNHQRKHRFTCLKLLIKELQVLPVDRKTLVIPCTGKWLDWRSFSRGFGDKPEIILTKDLLSLQVVRPPAGPWDGRQGGRGRTLLWLLLNLRPLRDDRGTYITRIPWNLSTFWPVDEAPYLE